MRPPMVKRREIGAVADLLVAYADGYRGRGISAAEIARRIRKTQAGVSFLFAGQRPDGSRNLGLGRDERGVALLLRVAAFLDVPEKKLAKALFDDLGWNEAQKQEKARKRKGKR